MMGLYGGWDAENEGMFIAKTIETLLAEKPARSRGDALPHQLAIATDRRSSAAARPEISGGRRIQLLPARRIKDAVAYLKLALSNRDSMSLMRVINVPARGIGRTTIEQVDAFARENGLSLWDAVSRMIDQQLFPARAQSALVNFRTMIQGISLRVTSEPLPDAIRFMLDRTGYGRMLEQESTPNRKGGWRIWRNW